VAVEVGCHDGLEFGQQAGLQSCHVAYATVTYGTVGRGLRNMQANWSSCALG
jgi:hypothetical protein